jgi:hypothetical protein
MPTTLDTLDPALESLRLSERYRQMTDEEVTALAWQRSDLTDLAQHALASEISRRRLKVEPQEMPVTVDPEPSPDSPYAEDRELVEICTVWSFPDALQLEALLDGAGIPFFMGPEKASSVDAVTSNFGNGISVEVMRIGLPWATQALQDYTPASEPSPKLSARSSALAARCPKCRSSEIIFERLIPAAATESESPGKYKWICDSCGHHWEDDGIVEES